MNKRKESINNRIYELNELLDQWEDHQVLARDPSEILKCKKEIQKIKTYLSDYHEELSGSGKIVEEDKDNPILKPALRRNNRKWMIGIFLSVLLLCGGYFTWKHLTNEIPNYNKYLEYLEKGNELIKAKKFEEAQLAYEKALEYNPEDEAAMKKVELLREANRMVETENFSEAEKLFKVIINVSASPKIAFNAKHLPLPPTSSQSVTEQLQIMMEWSEQILVITISGGQPFKDPNAPYNIKGIDCKDCIDWKKEGESFKAEIDGLKVPIITINISIIDSVGNSNTSHIPSRPEIASEEIEVEEKPVDDVVPENKVINKEEQFKTLVRGGDQLFEEKKYLKAKQDYQMALQIKSSDIHCQNRIKICEKELEAAALAAAKNIEAVPIKGGVYKMGFKDGFREERPVHDVTLNSFKISKYEITVGQYKAFCKYTSAPMPPEPSYRWNDDYPITNITWEEANSYCKWLGGSLPTEAQWEYAARDGGGGAIYSGGNQLASLANFSDNSGSHPKKVGSKRPNGFRIYDMTGNVSEWCADWYGKYSQEAVENPKGPDSGKYKIIRGGGFNSSSKSTHDGDQLRVTYRNSKKPNTRESYIGFRVVW